MFTVEVLLTEAELAAEFVASLERRYLAEKFFYWLPLSVQAWLDLCSGAQPYKNFSRSYALVDRHAAEIAAQIPAREIEVVSLGSGQGEKDARLIHALHDSGRAVRYRPVDSSQALVELAAARAADAGFDVLALKADVASERTARALASSARAPRLFLLLGNSLGVIDPREFLCILRRLLHPQDLLLVDGEIFNPQATMAGYDNPVNRRFAFAPLASIGLEEGRDGALVFESAEDEALPGLHLVAKHFHAARHLELSVAGRRLTLEAGERIEMNSSCKYSRELFERLVREEGGFRPLAQYASDDALFVMFLLAPSA